MPASKTPLPSLNTDSDKLLPEPLVNENPNPEAEPSQASYERQIADLKARLGKTETRNDSLIEQRDNLKAELEVTHKRALDAERKVVAFGTKGQRTRIFCELVNGAATAGEFRQYHATDNPKGVKSNDDVLKRLAHYAGIAEIAVQSILDQRF